MSAQSLRVERNTRFAERVLLVAGIVGLIELVPLYFAESTLSRTQPPPITHPDFYYGFIGVAAAWQVAFLIMSRETPFSVGAVCAKPRAVAAPLAAASGDLRRLRASWRRATGRVTRDYCFTPSTMLVPKLS